MSDTAWMTPACKKALGIVAGYDLLRLDTPWSEVEARPGTLLMQKGMIACNAWASDGGIYTFTHTGRAFVRAHPDIVTELPRKAG